jgi:hypothetical protein
MCEPANVLPGYWMAAIDTLNEFTSTKCLSIPVNNTVILPVACCFPFPLQK